MTNKENVAAAAQFFPPARKSVLDSDAFTKSNNLIPPKQMKVVGRRHFQGQGVAGP